MSTITKKMGTAITWINTGGDEVLTLTSLANGSARQGDKTDLGATFGVEYGFKLSTAIQATPTDGALVRIFMAFSEDDTTFAGGASGTDGAFSAPDALRNVLELTPLVCDNLTTAQIIVGKFTPLARYAAPIVLNSSGAALSATAGDHELVIWPINGDIT